MKRNTNRAMLSKPRVGALGLDDLAALETVCQAPLDCLQSFAYETHHYYSQFSIPKPSGGSRTIRPPKSALRQVQRRILDVFEAHTTWPHYLHGGIAGRSILTNARTHLGRKMVANLDIKSFFPTINSEAVREILGGFGIPEAPAALLAALLTYPDERGDRSVPQGAPTSPYLANHALVRADERFITFCWPRGLRYTRYVDDLTVSGDTDLRPYRGTFLQFVREGGYQVAAGKVHFCGRDQRQVVTGLVVNDRLRPVSSFMRELIALIKGCYWPGQPGLEVMAEAYGLTVSRMKLRILGKIAHVRMFDRQEARRLSALRFKKPLRQLR